MASIYADRSSDNWLCKKCDVTFSDLDLCISHNLEVHETSGIHVCNDCRDISFNKSEIEEHKKPPGTRQTVTLTSKMLICTKAPWSLRKKWPCEECNIPFTDLELYISHNVHVHKKSGIINCNFNCGVMHYTKSYMEQHMVLDHSDETHYCLICERFIYTSYNWDKHGEEHKAVVSNLLFKCDECNPEKHFILFKELRDHFREEHCSNCNVCKKLIKKRELREHMNIHSSQYPIQCTECSNRFKAEPVFKRHYTITHKMSRD